MVRSLVGCTIIVTHVLILTMACITVSHVHSWPDLPKDKQPEDDTILRHSQLQFRVKEIYHVINSMVRLSQGKDITRTSSKVPDFDWALWRGAVDANKPIVIGHSLGGSAAVCGITTTLQILHINSCSLDFSWGGFSLQSWWHYYVRPCNSTYAQYT
jgi:hypothetical protein